MRQLEILAPIVLSRNFDNVQRALLAAADLRYRASNRRTNDKLWPQAVNKEGLSDLNFVADIDLEGRTKAGVVTADSRNCANSLISSDRSNVLDRR